MNRKDMLKLNIEFFRFRMLVFIVFENKDKIYILRRIWFYLLIGIKNNYI